MKKQILCVLALLSSPEVLLSAPLYQIEDLGIADRYVTGVKINNRGDVVLTIGPQQAEGLPMQLGEAFLVEAPLVTPLGSLGGIQLVATAISDLGVVVGWADVGGATSHAIRFLNGQLEDLGAIGPNGSLASGINSSGQIIGFAGYPDGIRSFLREPNGDVVQLGTLGGDSSEARDINDVGDVVGSSRTAEGQFTAFFHHMGAMSSLGTLGGAESYATSINQAGEIVGSALIPGNTQHAAKFRLGLPAIDLAPDWALSGASDINDLGSIVGFVSDTVGGLQAAVFSVGEAPILLKDCLPTDSEWTHLFSASGINNQGQIVGTGILDGQTGVRAFLMTPIPEPSGEVLVAVMIALLANCRHMTGQRTR